MLHILSSFNFIDFYILLSSLFFISILFFAGRSITGPKELQAVQIPIGMFLIYVFFIIGSVMKPEFSIVNVIFFLVFLSFIGIWRSKNILSKDIIILLITFIFVSPLLIFGILSHNYLWDDYTNWIPPARYLYNNHHLPTLDEPIINHVTSSYSYLRALVHSIINLPIGEFVMNVQIIFNILFGSTIFLWSKPIARIINFRNKSKITDIIFIMGSFLCFLLIIWIFILKQFLFSSYSEATYLICLLHLYFYLIIKVRNDYNWLNQKFNYVLAILITLPLMVKDVGFYHSIILFFSFFLVFELPNILRNKNNIYEKTIKLILILSHLIPLILTKFLWSYYIKKNQLSEPFENLFFNDDKFNIIPEMLFSAMQQFISHTALIFSIFIIILLLFFSKKSEDCKIVSNYSLFFFTSLFSVGVILLTLIAYVLVFSPYEAQRAASFSRYIDPVVFILWSGIIISILNLSDNLNIKFIKVAAAIITIIYLLIIFLNINKYNFNKNIDDKYIKISSDMISSFPKKEPILIIDLLTNGIDSVKIKYYINEFMPVDYFASVHLQGNLDKEIISKWFEKFKNIHIHSASNVQLNIIKEYINEINE